MITSFFFSIPCWTHTFQLLFGDMQKRNCIVRDAFLITQQVAAQMTRTVTAKLDSILSAEGATKLSFPRPAETRWNSFVKCMLRILEIPS